MDSRLLLRTLAPVWTSLSFVLSLPLALAPTPAEAQQDTDLALRDLFDRASRGTWIRIHLGDGTEIQGPLADRGDDRVWLEGGDPITFGRIERVWVRGRATRRGAIIGVVTLGLIGGSVLGYDCSREGAELDCSVPTATALGTLAGAAAGFGLGTAIGAILPQWHKRFP